MSNGKISLIEFYHLFQKMHSFNYVNKQVLEEKYRVIINKNHLFFNFLVSSKYSLGINFK